MPVQDYAHCFGWDFGDAASEIHQFLAGCCQVTLTVRIRYLLRLAFIYVDAELPVL